jgi:hypothetical protein
MWWTHGLLLRADLHAFFDLGLICVDETTMRVLIAPSVIGPQGRLYRACHHPS